MNVCLLQSEYELQHNSIDNPVINKLCPGMSQCTGQCEGYGLIQPAFKHTRGDFSRFAREMGRREGSACLLFFRCRKRGKGNLEETIPLQLKTKNLFIVIVCLV